MTTLDAAELVVVCGGTYDPAKSDGCTLAPDGWWRQACVDHDEVYYYGGSGADRKRADEKLYEDMRKLGAPRAVAAAYYYGVRVGGAVPKTPWRWGYGASDT